MTGGITEPRLFGREPERELLETLLARALAGESGTLVIRGDAGVGKSALLRFAAACATGMKVLEVRGAEAEADLAFAGLHGLLRPILDKLEFVPPPQATALAGALGLLHSHTPDRFLISAAALSLLGAAAEETPLLCLIDDAQWLDEPSAEAMVFAARRLGADAVAVLFSASEWEGRRFHAVDLPELTLAGVDGVAAARILDAGVPDLDEGVRARILDEASGNPLALRELPRGLSEDERSGRGSLPDQLPLTPRLRDLFERRIRVLPPAGRQALLVAGLDGTSDTSVVLRALQNLELTADALVMAEEIGLIQTTAERIEFSHPLVRAATVEAAPLAERQRVHRALAEALEGEAQLDRRVWHQAMAALAGDEKVASALEDSARRAAARGGYASAAIAFQRAAELGRNDSRFGLRLAWAAGAAWNAGQLGHAHALIARALHFVSGDGRRKVLHLRATIEVAEGRDRDALATLLAAANEDGDPSVTLAILADIVEPAMRCGRPERFVLEAAERGLGLPTTTSRDAFNRERLFWFMKRFERDFEGSQPSYERAMQLAADLSEDPDVHYQAALLTIMTAGNADAVSQLFRAVELARQQGRIGLLPMLLAQQSLGLIATSRFEEAYAVAGEGLQLARDTRQSPSWNLVALAKVEAIRGDADAVHAHVDEALARDGDNFVLAISAAAARALLELGLGTPQLGVEILLRVSPGDKLVMAWTEALPDLVEAIVRAGHPAIADVDPLLNRLRRLTGISRWAGAQIARCEALLGVRPPDEAFTEALEFGDALPPFEHARTDLLYGEWLRRERRRKEARRHLRSASEEFRRLNARPWQDRADAELRASGETARKREPSTIRALSPQELQIAQLAAQGQSNPEIAAQLYLSPRTVEYHLRKVFSKLGISGRTELVRNGVAQAAE
jgi:DNA-binding CsgD family transcriptional regulator